MRRSAICGAVLLAAGISLPAHAVTPAADALFERGRFAEASATYAAVPSSSPDYQPALRRLGAIALYANRWDDAERYLLAAYSRNPGDAETEKMLAELAKRQGKFAQAAIWYRRAGNAGRATAFAAFGNAVPYRVISTAKDAEIAFVQTDPLPAVMARVNGHEGLFLIDTGGAEIVLDPAFAANAKVKAVGGDKGVFAGGKSATIAFGRIANFSLGALSLADVPAELIPTAGFSAAAQGKSVAGAIGTQLLMRFISTIDYAAGELVLAPRNSEPSTDKAVAEIPFWLLSDHLIVGRGAINGSAERNFIVDTGLAGFAFTAPASTLRDAGIAIPGVTQIKGGDIGVSAAVPFDIASLSLGDLTEKNLRGLYGPFPTALEKSLSVHIAGIISHQFFRPYAVTFDFSKMKIIMRKPGA